MRLWFFLILFSAAFSASGLEAGAAKFDISPPAGTPLNGDLSRMGKGAESVHDPIWARAVYLNDGATAVLWVTVDVWMISDELRERVLELAPGGVPPQNIILTATNTHSGPGGMMRPLPFRLMSGKFVPEVLEKTAQGIGEAMKAAISVKRPASIGFATAEQTDLTVNRRVQAGTRDPQLGVIRVEDADGNLIAVCANLAAQPATAAAAGGAENKFAISADYPGAFCKQFEILNPGCTALFMPGAGGNQDAANPEAKSGWSRIDIFGTRLAERVNELAGRTPCTDMKLRVAAGTVTLPATLAPNLLPRTAPVQILEIGGLCITFFPGEACAELGNELRQRALDSGYAAQFSVNTTNAYFGYFPPREYYAQPLYESRMNFYGPGIGDLLRRELCALMQKAPAPQETAKPEVPQPQESGGFSRLTLTGTWQEIGWQRGKLCGDILRQQLQERVLAPIQAGQIKPDMQWWTRIPALMDTSAYAVPIVAEKSRRKLLDLSDRFLQGLEGMAEGAELPFDAMWVAQNPPALDDPEMENAAAVQSPSSCLVASVGDRAGVDALFVGHVVYGEEAPEPLMVLEERPTRGMAVLQVTSPHRAGTLSGMNERGLVVCVERVPSFGAPIQNGPQISFFVHDVLQYAKSVQEALDCFQRAVPLRGYRLLVADSAAPNAVIVECRGSLTLRKGEKGLLFGNYSGMGADAEPGAMVKMLRAEHLVGSSKIRAAMIDSAAADSPWQKGVRYAVIFEPRAGSLRICVPDAAGAPGDFARVAFEGAGQ